MKNHSSRFTQLSTEAKTRIREIEINAVKNKLDRGEDVFLIDVREDHEWSAGHLPKALHLGKGIIERDIEKVIPDVNAEIILYCGGGHRSALAAESIQKMGYTNVYSIIGGMRAWMQSGHMIID